MQVKDLKPAGYNPRKITKAQLERLKKSLQEFGDLSGIVFNIRTQTLIGGHQRTKNLDPSKGVLYKKTPKGFMYYQLPDGKWKKCATLKIQGI